MKTNFTKRRSRTAKNCSLAAAALFTALSGQAQLVYQEGFNTDGEAAVPQRYTMVGRDKYNDPATELGLVDQLGPIYWAHNFEVSYVGVPAPTAGRRMVMAWDDLIDASIVTEDTWKLIESSVKWMVNNKAAATIIVSPDPAAIGALGERLTAAGYNLIADDTGITEANLPAAGDLFIHGPNPANSSRGATAKMPVMDIIALDHDDMLTSSIGVTANFQPASGTIATPSHPAAGGMTGTFQVTTGPADWDLIGDILPGNATILANFVQSIPPTVSSLADVDAMVAGTKASTKTTEEVAVLDFSDGSAGQWQTENPIPGGAAGIFGMRIVGKLNVITSGTYSFALGTDDGGRVQIDLNRNGTYEANETIINDVGPHGHTVMYGNAAFTATGEYNLQVIGYNSGGGGSLEVSVSNTAGAGQTDLIDLPEGWSNLGDPAALSPVSLQGNATVDVYVAAGEAEERTLPFIMLLNGPNDTPPGSVFGGGPFTGFEGAGFIGMAGGNKFPHPTVNTDPRTLTLSPIDVRGKTDLHLTLAMAATFLDFETGDYLDIVVYPNGKPGDEVVLARYSARDANTKYFVDVTHGNTNRLGLEFKDGTYKIPAGATDLVVEFRALTTWWNEILAFDNLRITQGAPTTVGDPKVTATREGNMVRLDITEGTGPFLVQGTLALPGSWTDLATVTGRTIKIPMVAPTAFLRIVDKTDKNVQLFVAALSGANERPVVDTPATGAGFVAINMTTKSATALLSYMNLKQAATLAHIHGPADANTSANPIVNLQPASALATSGLFTTTATLNDTQFNAITTGMSYFNVHSGAHGGGEIRGQILPGQ